MIQHETLPLFERLWWITNLLTILTIWVVLYVSKKQTLKTRDLIGRSIGFILLFNFLFTHVYQIKLGIWNIQSSLALHMCGISALLSGVVLIWRRQMGYEFLYYWGIPGAFHSLLTPEFTLGTQGWLFPDYYVSHGGIILAALYMTLRLGYAPRKGSWWRIALWSQIPIALVGVVNWKLDSNYMYLCERPIVDNPFVMGEWPWYLIGLYAAGLLHFIIVYLPFGLRYKRERVAT